MKITIETNGKEIAALVLKLQERQGVEVDTASPTKVIAEEMNQALREGEKPVLII